MALAFGVPESKREELRKDIVKHHGEKLELIAPKQKTEEENIEEK